MGHRDRHRGRRLGVVVPAGSGPLPAAGARSARRALCTGVAPGRHTPPRPSRRRAVGVPDGSRTRRGPRSGPRRATLGPGRASSRRRGRWSRASTGRCGSRIGRRGAVGGEQVASDVVARDQFRADGLGQSRRDGGLARGRQTADEDQAAARAIEVLFGERGVARRVVRGRRTALQMPDAVDLGAHERAVGDVVVHERVGSGLGEGVAVAEHQSPPARSGLPWNSRSIPGRRCRRSGRGSGVGRRTRGSRGCGAVLEAEDVVAEQVGVTSTMQPSAIRCAKSGPRPSR